MFKADKASDHQWIESIEKADQNERIQSAFVSVHLRFKTNRFYEKEVTCQIRPRLTL